MDGFGDRPDTSSIQPISSLRSRFENLSKNGSSNLAIVPDIHKPSKNRPDQASSELRLSHEGNGILGSGDVPRGNASPIVGRSTAFDVRHARTSARERPKSMISMGASHQSPPRVKIESPRSPLETMSVDLGSAATPSPCGIFVAGRARLETEDVPKATLIDYTSQMTPVRSIQPPLVNSPLDVKSSFRPTTATRSSTPPTVNRTAKPKIPQKPASLSPYSQTQGSRDIAFENAMRIVSPFSTPPSSGHTSPDKEKNMQPMDSAGSEQNLFEQLRQTASYDLVKPNLADTHVSSIGRPVNNSKMKLSHDPLPSMESSLRSSERDPTTSTDNNLIPSFKSSQQYVFGDINDIEEAKPRLPARPELQRRLDRKDSQKSRSLRSSPTRKTQLVAPRSVDGLEKAAMREASGHGMSNSKMLGPPQTTLTHGHERPTNKPLAPAVPPPRRSMDRRPESLNTSMSTIASPVNEIQHIDTSNVDEHAQALSDFPNASQVNRRPPRYRRRPHHISTEYDTRLVAVCGEIVCTSGYVTKAWNWRTGEQLLNMVHGENVKATAIIFKPTSNLEDEGRFIWLGTNAGDIHEVDMTAKKLIKTKSGAHARREIVRMFRYASELWTFDDGGELKVWKPDRGGSANLDSQFCTFRIPRGHTFSLACGRELWVASGKDIHVLLPGARSDPEFHLLEKPLTQANVGDVTCGTTLSTKPGLIYFGHSDGKVTVYDRRTYTCQAVFSISSYRISALVGVGEHLWAGFSTGFIYTYDPTHTPWVVKKEWKAHEKQICSIVVDPSAIWKADRLQVVTLGQDNTLRFWDGTLREDWLDTRLQQHDIEYCSFEEMTAAILTWNAGASKPNYLQHSINDSGFFQDYIRNVGASPDIFVFGFQELVDLEDKKMTAKSFFKSKKKDPSDQEHMSHQYRVWRDHLTRCLQDYADASEPYVLLHSSSLVGLFTCVFVKTSQRDRYRHIQSAEIKRGMGGLHGNKGALVVRMVIDDSSLCLVNCHLAAGQTQTMQRNSDIAAILEAECLPSHPLSEDAAAQHSDVFVSGGDGSMILDHEICILNGDLNYRIDTMGRDTVVKHVKTDNLGRLLERDQLLLSRKKNPGFRLRVFEENPITFAPTYKYDLRSQEYDTSEKRRSPAWCDRILFRGPGRVKLQNYRRWEVHVSDHRPVSGYVRFRIKSVHPDQRVNAWTACEQEFKAWRGAITKAVERAYLTDTLGLSHNEAMTALRTKA